MDALEWSGARWGAAYRNEREMRSCHRYTEREIDGFYPQIIELLKEESYWR